MVIPLNKKYTVGSVSGSQTRNQRRASERKRESQELKRRELALEAKYRRISVAAVIGTRQRAFDAMKCNGLPSWIASGGGRYGHGYGY